MQVSPPTTGETQPVPFAHKPKGAMTRRIARVLLTEFGEQGFEVLFDHGEKGIDPDGSLGKVRSTFGTDYTRYTALADLDIAIVRRSTNQVVALIEIEETNYNPKVLLGQIFGTLLGSQIAFQGKRHWTVGPWTTFVVLAKNGNRAGHDRMVFLEEQANQIKGHLLTPNATIGRVVVGEFGNEEELQQKLKEYVQLAVADSNKGKAA